MMPWLIYNLLLLPLGGTGFARTLTAVYGEVLLTLLLKIQLSIMGRYMADDENGSVSVM